MKTYGLVLGRFAGFHKGHIELIKLAAKENDGVIICVIDGNKSKSFDKNCISVKSRIRIINKILEFTDNSEYADKIIVYNSGYIPDIIAHLNDIGYDISSVYCGSDRYESYKEQITRANVNVMLACVDRDDSSASGTNLRLAIKADSYIRFASYMPDMPENRLVEIFDILKYSMTSDYTPQKKHMRHVEEVPLTELLDSIECIIDDDAEITQKLDGTINMGVTKHRTKFTFNRESKDQSDSIRYDKLDKVARYNPHRSAIHAIESDIVSSVLRECMKSEECIDMEILYGKRPNTIEYNLPTNYIAFLRSFRKHSDSIAKIIDKLKDVEVVTDSDTYNYNWDTETFEHRIVNDKWRFVIPEKVDRKQFDDESINKLIDILNSARQWLYSPCQDSLIDIRMIDKWKKKTGRSEYYNRDMLCLNMSNVSVNYRPVYVDIRTKTIEKANEYKLSIKRILLDMLSKIHFNVGGYEQEGYVIKDNNSGRAYKIIDKTKFTIDNIRNWKYRELLEYGYKDIETGEYSEGIKYKFGNCLYSIYNSLCDIHTSKFEFIYKNTITDMVKLILKAGSDGQIVVKLLDTVLATKESILELIGEIDNIDTRTSDTAGEFYNQLNECESLLRSHTI